MTSTLDRELLVESIAEEDGWFCIVLPELGFGWVQAANVQLSDDDEPIASDAKLNVLYEFKINNVFGNKTAIKAYPAFIESIGRQLSALDLSGTGLHEGDIFKTVIASCPNVKHLTLRGCNLLDPYFVPLFDALDGDLGLQLLTLNLNENFLRKEAFRRLTTFLTQERTPSL